MVCVVESIVACALFTLMIKLISHNRQEGFTNDYPPVVTDKLRALGLIALIGFGGGLVRFSGAL